MKKCKNCVIGYDDGILYTKISLNNEINKEYGNLYYWETSFFAEKGLTLKNLNKKADMYRAKKFDEKISRINKFNFCPICGIKINWKGVCYDKT